MTLYEQYERFLLDNSDSYLDYDEWLSDIWEAGMPSDVIHDEDDLRERNIDPLKFDEYLENKKKIGLLNYEGDVLKAVKENGRKFGIYDQWDNKVATFTKEEMINFFNGKTKVTDSSGKSWNWHEEHEDAKPPFDALINFMNS